MEESEQLYMDFREDFRESTTMSLKKLEIQNAILEQKNKIQNKKIHRLNVLCISLCISCIIVIACMFIMLSLLIDATSL